MPNLHIQCPIRTSHIFSDSQFFLLLPISTSLSSCSLLFHTLSYLALSSFLSYSPSPSLLFLALPLSGVFYSSPALSQCPLSRNFRPLPCLYLVPTSLSYISFLLPALGLIFLVPPANLDRHCSFDLFCPCFRQILRECKFSHFSS